MSRVSALRIKLVDRHLVLARALLHLSAVLVLNPRARSLVRGSLQAVTVLLLLLLRHELLTIERLGRRNSKRPGAVADHLLLLFTQPDPRLFVLRVAKLLAIARLLLAREHVLAIERRLERRSLGLSASQHLLLMLQAQPCPLLVRPGVLQSLPILLTLRR